jgi:hypothetical protein
MYNNEEEKQKAQYTFDVVAAHLLEQNKQSKRIYDDSNVPGCSYRGDNGLRCAVGFCIPEKNYRPSFEGKGIADFGLGLDRDQLAIIDAIDPQYFAEPKFMAGLQWVHDNNVPSQWPDRLKAFATVWELESSMVDTTLNAQIPQPELAEVAQNA